MNKNHKRISAAVLSLALGFSAVGAPVLAPMAGAQVTGQVSTVDPNALASLTIEKYLGVPAVDPSGMPGMEATFTVTKVEGLNELTTQAGWEDVNALLAAVDENTSAKDVVEADLDLSLGASVVGITENDGSGKYIAEFPGLAVGVYLVEETPQTGIREAAPFFVTLPYVNADGSGWNYELTVQPKNQDDTRPEKSVDDTLATLGSISTYTIEMAIPEGDVTSIQVLDELPEELDNINEVKVYHTAVHDDNEIDPFGENNSNAKTLDLLINNTAAITELKGKNLFVTFEAQIVNLPEAAAGDQGGVIENHATVEIKASDATYTYETNPDDSTKTKLGQLTITKQGYFSGELGTIEDGTAEFELWRCTEQAEDKWALGAGPLAMGLGETKQTTFETLEGVAEIEGVQMANFVNDTELDPYTDSTLCVVETKAPAGYVLNPEPQPVLTVGEDYTMSVNVINLDDTIDGQLPATGGMGTMAMIAGGLLVAVAGGFAALRGNRARG